MNGTKIHRILGYLFFIAFMSGGYYYNLTFVQIGILDLANKIGLSSISIGVAMSIMAILALISALATAFIIKRNERLKNLKSKLKILSLIIIMQTLAIVAVPTIGPISFFVWISIIGLSIGAAIPVTFSTIINFIKVPDRPYIAAIITGTAFLLGLTYPFKWSIDSFYSALLLPMIVISIGTLLFAFMNKSMIENWEKQSNLKTFNKGRYSNNTKDFWVIIGIMFFIFFIDSLGFIRIIETPSLMQSAWQSDSISTQVAIGIVHLIAAFGAASIYSNMKKISILMWSVGIFALTHFIYSFSVALNNGGSQALSLPFIYAAAVSFYTVINFTIWADYSTKENIEYNTAIGVGISGWLATFFSTGIAFYLNENITLMKHLNIINAISILLFIAIIIATYILGRKQNGN